MHEFGLVLTKFRVHYFYYNKEILQKSVGHKQVGQSYQGNDQNKSCVGLSVNYILF